MGRCLLSVCERRRARVLQHAACSSLCAALSVPYTPPSLRPPCPMHPPAESLLLKCRQRIQQCQRQVHDAQDQQIHENPILHRPAQAEREHALLRLSALPPTTPLDTSLPLQHHQCELQHQRPRLQNTVRIMPRMRPPMACRRVPLAEGTARTRSV